MKMPRVCRTCFKNRVMTDHWLPLRPEWFANGDVLHNVSPYQMSHKSLCGLVAAPPEFRRDASWYAAYPRMNDYFDNSGLSRDMV